MRCERILDLIGIGDTWDYWMAQAGCHRLELKQRQYFSTYVLSLNMAREGKGVSMGHNTLVERMVRHGELSVPFDLGVPGRDGYFLVQNRNGRPNPYAVRFVDWVRGKFSECGD